MDFKVGDIVECVNNRLLKGNDFGPPLIEGELYRVLQIIKDSQDNQHLDVGLKSNLNYIRSYETKEHLTKGDQIHWCHPSRFTIIRRFIEEGATQPQ